MAEGGFLLQNTTFCNIGEFETEWPIVLQLNLFDYKL